MKKNIFRLSILLGALALIIGGTVAYFVDTEKSQDNSAGAGTFDISDEGTWTKSYSFSGIYPGKDPEQINFSLKNKGSLPMRVWMIIKNVNNEENGILDAEQDWYTDNNEVKNDVDSAMVYSLKVDGNLALEQEAGITVSEIKDYYLNLVKTDQPFGENNGDGILRPGHTISIEQKFYLPLETENWAQSDIMNIEIEILAQQVNAQEPIKQLSYMQNKNSSWVLLDDSIAAVLKYDSMAEDFNYNFTANGLTPSAGYSLIYYADPSPGNHPGALIGTGTADGDGILSISSSKDLGMNLPYSDDANYPYGAKIWLVRSGQYNSSSNSVTSWDHSDWFFDNWPGLIRYEKSTDGASASTQTVALTSLGADPQFGPTKDYNTANVSFSYNTPALDKLSGTLTATGLKPNMTYQVKFIGKPTCQYSSGDDSASEGIGYKGRWTVLGTSCTGSDCNRTDAQYESNKTSATPECIAGYLVWGYVTADSTGAVTKTIETDSSYHVLWCGGGTCGAANNSKLSIQSPYPTCAAGDVNGQIERSSCGGLSLDEREYDLKMVLNEESFHQSTYGVWTDVMSADINFEIE